TRDPRLLGPVRIHIPLLTQMWLACARDSCVVSVSARDAYEELDALRRAAPDAAPRPLDAGLGLQLGLEASYVGLVRSALLPWYRLYAPAAIRALLALVLAPPGTRDALGLGHDCLLDLVERYDRVRLADEGPERQPSQAAVLLLCALLQELARRSDALPAAAGDDRDLPVPGAPGRLVDELDVCAHELAGAAPDDPQCLARRAADTALLIGALGELLRDADTLRLAAVFAAAGVPGGCKVSWLVEELWRRAAAGPLRAFVAAQEQPAVAAVAAASLTTAAALIRALGAASLARQWLFDADADPSALAAGGDLCQALGCSAFGAAVVRDAVAAWQAARAAQPALAAGALRVLALVMAQSSSGNHSADDSAPLLALWLSMWRQSLALSTDAETAAASLAEFVCLMAGGPPAQAADMLTGDVPGRGDLAAAMASSLLAQMLVQDGVRGGLLPVVARLLAGSAFAVSPAVRAQFVAAYPACLAAWSATETPALLAVPGILAAASPGSADMAAPVLAALARESIPIIAARAYAQLDAAPPQGDSSTVDGSALAALVQFATAECGAPAGSGPVAAAVLMVLLSMLPEEGPLGARDGPVTDAILALAAAQPQSFRDIVLRLSAAHASARKRLELAIRSHAPAEDSAAVAATAKGAARRPDAKDLGGI
ncbi:hypothetical protein H4R19_003498, partial [Coemansia spiralis]